MREIKFKAWDKKNKKFWDSNTFSQGTYWSISNEGFVDATEKNVCRESYDFELLQFTGVKDKNGKEIYEGDIVETFNSKKKKMSAGIWKIFFNNYCGCFDAERISNREEDSGEDFECVGNVIADGGIVLGNIYENPEILSNQSPPVRTSDKSDSANAEEFNTDLKEVQK